jgi:hypothetical protein
MTKQAREPWAKIYPRKHGQSLTTGKRKRKQQRKWSERSPARCRIFPTPRQTCGEMKRGELLSALRISFIFADEDTGTNHATLAGGPGRGYPNVWLSVTAVSKRDLRNMDVLRQVPIHPKAVRGLSVEPLLEDIPEEINLDGFGWIVVGAESGSGDEYIWNPNGDWKKELQQTSGRRTMKLEWAEKLRDKTKAAGLPFHFKQVTSPCSGVGINALGQDCHGCLAPPLPFLRKPRQAIEVKHLFTIEQLMNLDAGGRPVAA